jgi:hypothetical protein
MIFASLLKRTSAIRLSRGLSRGCQGDGVVDSFFKPINKVVNNPVPLTRSNLMCIEAGQAGIIKVLGFAKNLKARIHQ